MILFHGDKIIYKKDGNLKEGVVGSVSGDRIYLQCGWVTSHSKIVEVVK